MSMPELGFQVPALHMFHSSRRSFILCDCSEGSNRPPPPSLNAPSKANHSRLTAKHHRLSKEVATALKEATDCVRFLTPLRPHLLKVTDSSDFPALPECFGPLMATLLLVWTHSRHFNTPAKLMALLRRLSNALIAQARQFLPGWPSSISKSPPPPPTHTEPTIDPTHCQS